MNGSRSRLISVLLLALLPAASALAGPSHSAMLVYYDRMIVENPSSPTPYLRRANAFAELGDWDHAFDDLELARELGAGESAAIARADFLVRTGEVIAAREELDRILKSHGGNYRALIKRAEVLLKLEQFEEALADYLALFELRPNSQNGFYREAAKLLNRLQGADAALALLDKRMAVTGPIPQLQATAIDIAKADNRFADAEQRMHRLHPLSKATAFWHVDLAEIMFRQKRAELAISHLDQALSILALRQRTEASLKLLGRISQMRALVK